MARRYTAYFDLVADDLRKLDRKVSAVIAAKIRQLEEVPRPPGCAKLKCVRDLYRIHVDRKSVV